MAGNATIQAPPDSTGKLLSAYSFTQSAATVYATPEVPVGADGNALFPNAAALADAAANPTTALIGALGLVWNGATWDRERSPNIFKTGTFTATGNTALWTPTTGKKFRIMGFVAMVTNEVKAASAADLAVTLNDSSTSTGIAVTFNVPTTAATAAGSIMLGGEIDMENGYLSSAANNVLNVNLSATLTGGQIRVTAWGTEE